MMDEGDGGSHVSDAPPDAGGSGVDLPEGGGDPSSAASAPPEAGSPVQGDQPGSGFDIFETARSKYGVDLSSKYKSPEQALQGLLHAQQLVGRRNEEAELGRLYRDYDQEFREFLDSRRQQVAAPQQADQPQKKDPWWNPPPVDQAYNKYLVRNPETGEVEFAENTPSDVRRAIEARQQYLERWQYNLVNDPETALKGIMEQVREQILEETNRRYGTAREIDRRTHEASQIFQNVQSWVYQRTGDGQVVLDVSTGKPAFSPAGAYYVQQMYRLKQAGVTNQKEMDEIARGLTYAAFSSAQKPAAESAPAGTQPAKEPAGGKTPGRPRTGDTKGMSLAEKLAKAAKGLPEKEFVA